MCIRLKYVEMLGKLKECSKRRSFFFENSRKANPVKAGGAKLESLKPLAMAVSCRMGKIKNP